MRTRALADEDGAHRLTGTKQWITNGSHAHTFLVFARDPAAGDRPSAFVVRRGAPGFRVTREEEKLGLNSSSTADLSFEDTPGRAARRAGRRACGSRSRRSTAGASASPPRRRASRRRRSTSRPPTRRSATRSAAPIGGFQAIQQKLADMQTEIEAARALDAARRAPEGRRPPAHGRGRAGQALRHPRRAPLDRRGDPGPRRLRLHEGVPGRALLPRRQGHRDLRGHERDPAPRDRPRAARRGRARELSGRRGKGCGRPGRMIVQMSSMRPTWRVRSRRRFPSYAVDPTLEIF